MFIVDSHCHINLLNYKHIHQDLDDVLNKSYTNDVKFILAVSTNFLDFYNLKKIVGNRSNIVLSCGIHPLKVEHHNYVDELMKLAIDQSVVAIGETGLDYYYKFISKVDQQISFRKHIQVGQLLNKPIIIHARNASNDIINILQEERINECGGVWHCFTEDIQFAKKILDMGLYLSFSGIVTFGNSHILKNTVRYVPLDRILVETDSPYLSPVPYRGKENQPAYVRNIAQYVALLKNIDLELVAQATTENFSKLFQVTLI